MVGIELRGEIVGVLHLHAVVGTFAVGLRMRVNGEGRGGRGEGVVASECGGGGEDIGLHCVGLGEGGAGEEDEEEDGAEHLCGLEGMGFSKRTKSCWVIESRV